ncbi:MAG: sensor histidine kinase [Sphingobacteriales bacterium]|nr:MAG: sensor histidine kinase [Sphingobacteriales bacterium]
MATNAIKYGALSVPEGRVDLTWAFENGGSGLSLSWIEKGGPPAQTPSRTGYGTRYLRSALTMLFGSAPKLLYGPEGFSLTACGNNIRLG